MRWRQAAHVLREVAAGTLVLHFQTDNKGQLPVRNPASMEETTEHHPLSRGRGAPGQPDRHGQHRSLCPPVVLKWSPHGEINNIIGVIDGIAYQTKLLIDVAVEAARTGEQVRGFPGQPPKCVTWISAEAAKEVKG